MIIGKSLTALGSGGLKPEITVTAKAGALLNLHYKDSSIILQSYQLGTSETNHTFVVSVSETAYVVEDVTNRASVEVLVDSVSQYNVEIEYVLWLYKEGDECTSVTGGWERITSGYTFRNTEWQQNGTYNQFIKNSDNLEITSYYKYSVLISPVNKIDLSTFTEIHIETETRYWCFSTDAQGTDIEAEYNALVGTLVEDGHHNYVTLTKPYGLTKLFFFSNSGNSFKIHKIWLE